MSHYYVHPKHGKKVPSPTTVLAQLDKSGPLTYWAANCACDYILQEITEKYGNNGKQITLEDLFPIVESARKHFKSVSNQALDIGSAVHEAIKHYFKTGQEPQAPSDEVLAGFLAFLEWKDQHKLKVLKSEHTVYDSQGLYAGTLDLLCVLDSKTYVIDFKTTKRPQNNKPYEEWAYQLAAYAKCAGQPVEGIGIVRLDKETGEPDWYDLTDQRDKAYDIFMKLLEVWYLRHPDYPK